MDWKFISGYGNRYKINMQGDVISMPTGCRNWSKTLPWKIDYKGYARVYLYDVNGKRWTHV